MPKNDTVSETTADFARDSLTGDIAAFLIDRLRDQQMVLAMMPEDKQRDVIDDAMKAAGNLVAETVSIIAADGRDTIPVQVKKVVNDGDKIQVTIEARKSDTHRHALFDAAGCFAHLTVADVEQYEGGEAPDPDADEPNLPIDGDSVAA